MSKDHLFGLFILFNTTNIYGNSIILHYSYCEKQTSEGRFIDIKVKLVHFYYRRPLFKDPSIPFQGVLSVGSSVSVGLRTFGPKAKAHLRCWTSLSKELRKVG